MSGTTGHKACSFGQVFTPAGFFVLRTPLLPFNEFFKWSDGLKAVAALDDPDHFEDAYNADCERLRKRLNSIVSGREVRDALFLASPNIIERLHLWTDDPHSERGRKVEHVLIRYFARMTGRATPFGLFAGVSTGIIGDKTNLVVEEGQHYRRHTRLDMSFLSSVTDAITRDTTLRKNLSFHSNYSLYRVGDRLHYVESRMNENARSYHLVALEETEYLAAALDRALSGATPGDLAATLVDDEVALEDARNFVAELIDNQVVVPDIGLNVSGPAPVQPLIEQLRRAKETAAIAGALQYAQEELGSIDREGLGVDVERYRLIAHSLESLPAKVELSSLFHVDLVKPAPAAMLGTEVLKEIERGIKITHGLSPRRRENELTNFREAFSRRYEEREVPLLEALDEEVGVGFGNNELSSPLLDDIDLPTSREERRIEAERHVFNLRKLCEALSSGASEINISEAEIEDLTLPQPHLLPDSFAFEVTLAARSPSALAKGDFRVLIGQGSGPSAALSMGRFCHADENMYQKVMTLLRNEEALRPDAVFAEIVYLPEGKLGNLASRPQMRDYEIPILTRSVVDCDHQIPLADIFVSVRDNRIRLRSARLSRELIPRMTNAHYYSLRSPGVYRFLCMLQNQDAAMLSNWDWGVLATAPFLPRVCSGRLVLSPARWHARKEEVLELGKAKEAARFRAVQSWRKERRLPRFFTLAEQDNLLLVDLENVLSVESFVQLAKERESATLIELFPAPDELCVSGPEGSFVHELFVPFLSEPVSGARSAPSRVLEASSEAHPPLQTVLTRHFSPGSEWLYAKLYTGPATADRVLRDLVSPLVKGIKSEGDADLWFFIRYCDPDFHLRLRFHGEPSRLRDRLQPLIKDALATFVADNRIWRVQFDTYEREVERYGGAEGIVLSEELFQIDSEAVLQLIKLLDPGDTGADERWRLTVYGIDRFLDDFGFEVNLKHSILKELRDAFAKEFEMDQSLRIQLNDKFREERNALQTLLNSAPDSDHPLAPGLAVIQNRSRQMSGVVNELRSRERKGHLSRSLRRLMPNYIHMYSNRLLRSAQRAQELVIYHLLTRLYESQLKRPQTAPSTRTST